jgi:hypothetical protein
VRQWVAHAGLDPRAHQAGTSVDKPARISKVGNAHIRRALYMPALVAVQRNEHVRAFFAKLVARGKTPLQAGRSYGQAHGFSAGRSARHALLAYTVDLRELQSQIQALGVTDPALQPDPHAPAITRVCIARISGRRSRADRRWRVPRRAHERPRR